MSDLSTTDYTTSRITFSSDLEPREDEEVLSEEDAAKLLADRFGLKPRSVSNLGRAWDVINPLPGGGHGVRSSDPTGQDLMVRIIRMLPEQYRTKSILTYVDVRPILEELMLTQEQAARTTTVHYVNDVPVTPDERVRAGELLLEQTRVIEDQALVIAAAMEENGEFGDDPNARQQFIEQMVNGYKGQSELGPTPELLTETVEGETLEDRDAATAQLQATSLHDQLLMEAGLIDASQTPFAFLSDQDVQFMFRMNMVDWAKILESERNKTEARNSGMTSVPEDLQVDTGGLITRPDAPIRTSEDGSTTLFEKSDQQAMFDDMFNRGDRTRVRMLDVMNSLYSSERTPQELQNLQDKLIAAGYLNEDDVRWWGRATDDATVDAWRTLIRDSINLGKDMASLLKDQTLAKAKKDEEEDKKSQRDLVLTSSVGIQSTADVLGQQVLGRKLSKDQHARLIEFVHQLETEQHNRLAPEGGQVAEAIDVEAEVNAWIERENGPEAGAYDLLEQFNAFNQIARQRG